MMFSCRVKTNQIWKIEHGTWLNEHKTLIERVREKKKNTV